LGQLICEGFSAAFSGKNAEVSADFLEWKSTGDFDRGKILIRSGLVSLGENRLDQVSGSCFYSRMLGFFWKVSNPSFFCDGSLDWESGEWKANCSGTSLAFQGRGWDAKCEGGALFLKGKWLQQEACAASFSFFGGSGRRGVVAFSDLQGEGQIEKGSFSTSTLTGSVNGIGIKGGIEGSLAQPALRLRLTGAVPHLECQGSLFVQTELFSKKIKVETNFSHFVIRRTEGEIVFSEMEKGLATYEEGEWSS
jgi:hypothetical protein